MRFGGSSIAILLCFSNVVQAAAADTYVARKGETLSEIAQRYLGNPVFTKNGSLRKILKLNPQIRKAKFIYAGQTIYVGHDLLAKSAVETPVAQIACPPAEPLSANQPVVVNRAPSAENLVVAPSPPVLAPPTVPPGVPTSETQNEDPLHSLALSAGSALSTFVLQDTKTAVQATLLTSEDIAVAAKWSQAWTPSFGTYFSFGLRRVEFEPSTNLSISLSGDKKTLQRYGFGVVAPLSTRFVLSAELSYDSELFVHGFSTNQLNIDAVPILGAAVRGDYSVLNLGRTSLGLNANAGYLNGTTIDSYSVNSGFEYGAGIYMRRAYGIRSAAELNLGFTDRVQNTSVVKTDEQSVSLHLKMDLPLFEGGQR